MRSFAERVRGAQLQLCAIALLFACVTATHAQENVEALYKEAVSRETALRQEIDTRGAGAAALPLLRRVRILVSTFEDIARLFPKSAYGDNALWQGGMLSANAFYEFGEAADRTSAMQLLNALATGYPSSSLIKQVQPQITRLASAAVATPSRQPATAAAAPIVLPRVTAPQPRPSASSPVATPADAPVDEPTAAEPPQAPAAPTRAVAAPAPARQPRVATLRAIRHEVLPGALRITLELDREVAFHDERLDGPPRVFVDLVNTQSAASLKDTVLTFASDVVPQIRTGRQVGVRTRVVLNLKGAGRHSVYALYNPFRVVVDVERPGAAPTTKDTKAFLTTKDTKDTKDTKGVVPVPIGPSAVAATATASVAAPSSTPTIPVAAAAEEEDAALPSPVAPKPNADGSLSLSRQLGLGVSRIVIDPGHGGHDPGAKATGLTEAELVLDIATRLEKLLAKEPGVEVVLTRRTNAFVSLEERTAIANREQADLFLSIHANSNDDPRIRGVETYFLNFAQNKQAEAVAARENASATQTISNLPDIVKAITLNNKLDESRDFASELQTALMDRLRQARKTSRNLGVKQAPFMVLIGAGMPSALVEISFLTNRQEQAWLKTELYRRQLAEALFNGIMKYQRSLKGAQVAAQ